MGELSQNRNIIILGIESSCDDTSAAILRDEELLSNVMASQDVHEKYGGVVPELASRAHQQNILPVVERALKLAEISLKDIDLISFTRGPGLLGSLLVGTSFAKGLSISLEKPLVDVNHLHGHILSHFIRQRGEERLYPKFPFLCLLVSGGHTQIVKVSDYLAFEIIGSTIDDAVGEAFDKCSKVMGLGYPGGPIIDRLSKSGNQDAFTFAKPKVENLDYSFSGLKTSFLYFLREAVKRDNTFIENNISDLSASLQRTIVDILMGKLIKATEITGIKEVAISGGVSANSGLRDRIVSEGKTRGWRTFIPEFKFTTDNAAMIAIAGYHKYRSGYRCPLDISPISRSLDYL